MKTRSGYVCFFPLVELHCASLDSGHRFPFVSVAAQTLRASTISARSQLWRGLIPKLLDRQAARVEGGGVVSLPAQCGPHLGEGGE
jgi:hypothetical protein